MTLSKALFIQDSVLFSVQFRCVSLYILFSLIVYLYFQQLLPRVEVLDLSYNKLDTIEHLNWLSQLTVLNLSCNNICHLDSLHTKLGNLKKLDLSGNKLSSLSGTYDRN